MPPLVPTAGRYAKDRSRNPPIKATVEASKIYNLDSWRQVIAQDEESMVLLIVVQRSGSLSPRTFQLKNDSSSRRVSLIGETIAAH
jgi:hypothetical protein